MSEVNLSEPALTPQVKKIRKQVTAGSYGWMVTAALLWGTVGVGGAVLQQVEPVPSLTVGFLRMFFAAPFLVLLSSILSRQNPFNLLALNRKEWLYFSLMGVAMACYQVFYFAAIPLASVTLVVVIALCTSPLMVALLSIPIFNEKITGRVLLALFLALLGTAILASGGGKGGDFIKPQFILGSFLAFGAGLSYSCFAVLSKLSTSTSHRGPVESVAVAFSLSAILLFPVAAFTGNLQLKLVPLAWSICIYLGIVPTALAYVIFLKGLKQVRATAATIITLLEPAVAAFLAWLVLGESLSFNTFGGSVLLLGSVYLIIKR